MNESDNVSGIPVPDFSGMLTVLTRATFHIPTNWIDIIPIEYTQAGGSRPPASMGTPPPASGGGSSGSGTGGSQRSGRSGQSSVDSSLTGHSTPAGSVTNTAPDAEFLAITLRAGRSRDVFCEHLPPTQ